MFRAIAIVLLVVLQSSVLGQESPDIFELEDQKQDLSHTEDQHENQREVLLDASSLGTGREFYSRPFLVLQVGGRTKTYQKILGDAKNNNHFVAESNTGDTLVLYGIYPQSRAMKF